MGMVIQGHGTCLPIRETAQQALRRLQRLTGLVEEMQKNYPNISLMQPEYTFLDEELAKRIILCAIQSDPDLRSLLHRLLQSHWSLSGNPANFTQRVHVHTVTPDNIEMVREGIVDFIIGQDEQTPASSFT